MSSLGRAPEGAENPGEVGTGSTGVVGTVGSELTEVSPIEKVGVAEGGEATKGDPVQIDVVDPDHQSVLEMEKGDSNQIKSRDVRGSVDLELEEDRGVDNVYRYSKIGDYLNEITGCPIKRPWQAPPPAARNL